VRLRLEQAWPEFGWTMAPTTNPHQAALDHRAVCWTKGCYVGQEVVCMTDQAAKVRRRVALVVFVGPEAPPVGAEVRLAEDGSAIGAVTTRP
jgi:folate-binding protein YgfZ